MTERTTSSSGGRANVREWRWLGRGRALVPFLLPLFPLAAVVVSLAPPRLALRGPEPTAAADMTGRPLALQPPARRLMIYPPALRDYLALDGGAEHVLGVAGYQIAEISRSLLGTRYSAATLSPAPTQGDAAIPAGAEPLLLARPDAILSWPWFSDSLVAAGLPVVELTMGAGQGGDSDKTWWRVLAAVAGKTQRGEALLARSEKQCAAVEQELPPLTEVEKPRVAFLAVIGLDEIHAAVGDHDMPGLLQRVGARDATAGFRTGRIGIEQLLLMNPDVIFLDWRWGGRNSPDALYEEPALQPLAAVRNRRIYIAPENGSAMDNVIQRPLLERWMAETLHPQDMPRRFRAEVKEAYLEVFGLTLSDDELDAAIYLHENSGSAGFDRFARLPGRS